MKCFKELLLPLLLLSACSQSPIDEEFAPSTIEGEPIEFTVSQQEGRASFFQGEGHGVTWDGNEIIGIRAYDIDTPSSNKQRGNYTVAEDGTCAYKQHAEIVWNNTPLTITAYYPATNNATATNLWEIPMSDQQVQKADGDHSHLTNYMVMQTEPQDFTQKPDAVRLEFHNLCAIVELTIKGSASHTVRHITLTTASESYLSATQLKLDATQSLFDDKGNLKANAALAPYKTEEQDFGSKQVHLSLTTPAALSEEGAKFYMVVLPGEHDNEDITIWVETTDGKIATKTMGAIAFKMNKVYRPTVSFNDSDFKTPIAEIKHRYNRVGEITYSTPVAFEEEAAVFLGRSYYLYNVPTMAEPCQVATIQYSTYPTYNRIIAETDGFVYLLADGKEAIVTQLTGFGWEPVTKKQGENDASTFGTDQIYYNANAITSGSASGLLTLYRRWMQQGEEFDLTTLTEISGFRGIRPVAKAIHGEYYDNSVVAEIQISGIDTAAPYFGSINYENGATIFASRTQTNGHASTMRLEQVWPFFTHSDNAPWQTLTSPNTTCPNVTITAVTAGKVYMSTNGSSKIGTNLKNAGWTLETTLSTTSTTEAIKYSDGTSEGYLAIWSKQVKQDTVIYLSKFLTEAVGEGGTIPFQGVRPVAKKIAWPLAKVQVEQTANAAMTTFEAGNSLTTQVVTSIEKSDKKSLPSGYLGMDLYAVNGSAATTTVTAKAQTAGMVYAICPASLYPTHTDIDARNAMDNWKQIESFYCSDGNLYYIVAKQVAQDEEIKLSYGSNLTPIFDRSNIGTGILMGDLTETTQPLGSEITVRGTLIDIRPLTHSIPADPAIEDDEGTPAEFFPQNKNYILPEAGGMGDLAEQLAAEGYSYAVGLQEKRGPESFTTKQAGTVYIGTNGLTPSGWTKAGTLNVIKGSATVPYTIYKRSCTANETVELPSGGATSTIVFGKKLRVEVPALNTVLNGGIVLATVTDDAFRKRHATNPNIHILPDGSYLALVTNTLYSRSTAIYRSTDKGSTWSLYSTPTNMNFTRLFEHKEALYIMGIESDGELIICKSTDNGKTWTKPDANTRSGYIDLGTIDGEPIKGHQAPTTMAIWDGRIWRAMESNNGEQGTQNDKLPFVISAPIDADLLDPNSWSATSPITTNLSSGSHAILRLIEGNVVVGPDGKLYNLLRASSYTTSAAACLGRVVKSGSTYQLEANSSDMITMPGGGKKFTVLYDEQSGLYWTLTNPNPDSEAYAHKHNGIYSKGMHSDIIRNRVSLYSSPDLKNWTLRKENVLYNADPFFHGFQYIDFKIDGNDIIFVSRTAIPEERGLPIRQHDANMVTFHRIKNFRN